MTNAPSKSLCDPFVTNAPPKSLCDPFVTIAPPKSLFDPFVTNAPYKISVWPISLVCRWSTSHCEISGWGMQEYNNTASYPDSVRAARIELCDHTSYLEKWPNLPEEKLNKMSGRRGYRYFMKSWYFNISISYMMMLSYVIYNSHDDATMTTSVEKSVCVLGFKLN